jgi:catechol 2,3-dioxygenase-like lactoylglutathione lyase family enzyme
MKIKLHEIELGVSNPNASKEFYRSLPGMSMSVDQPALKVFHTGIPQLDLNFSTHLGQGEVMLSFICDDLEAAMELLKNKNISFEGPVSSHLGMRSISFRDPGGYKVKINQASADSPAWLTDLL